MENKKYMTPKQKPNGKAIIPMQTAQERSADYWLIQH
jgi:hypothetical protein